MECVPAPPPYETILLARYNIFSTPKQDELAYLVRKFSPPHPTSKRDNLIVSHEIPKYKKQVVGAGFRGPLLICLLNLTLTAKLASHASQFVVQWPCIIL